MNSNIWGDFQICSSTFKAFYFHVTTCSSDKLKNCIFKYVSLEIIFLILELKISITMHYKEIVHSIADHIQNYFLCKQGFRYRNFAETYQNSVSVWFSFMQGFWNFVTAFTTIGFFIISSNMSVSPLRSFDKLLNEGVK